MRLLADPIQTYIGLGSNLENPLCQLRQARTSLSELEHSRYIRDSGIFKSPPMGPQDQPDYLNAVVLLETRLPARELLAALQAIENRQGRVREQRWGARTLDLDILIYGDLILDDPDLYIPHLGIADRSFVLYPLQRIDPELIVPGVGPLASLIQQCPAQGLEFAGEF